MKLRAGGALAAALAAAALVQGGVVAQGQGPARNRRVWVGTIDDRVVGRNLHDTAPARHPVQYFHDIQLSYVYVSEAPPDDPAGIRWVSRKVRWEATGASSSIFHRTDCETHGEMDLGPAEHDSDATPAQLERLHLKCNHWSKPGTFTFTAEPPPSVPLPSIDLLMTDCEPARRWTERGVWYSQSVSGSEVQGAFQIFPIHGGGWTPEPGRQYLIRGWSNTQGRWKFALESSRLRGYATNADVTPAFFDLFGLQPFAGRYGTLDPDLIFDPALSDRDSEWRPPSPGSGPRKWSTIESKQDTAVSRVELNVTAMDFGAHGELRAFFAPACGGGWREVPRENTTETTIAIPEDKDGNLIADGEPLYAGIPALADDDNDPAGDGTAGDGFTAFEEYRGFVQSTQPACDAPLRVRHERTSPKLKDLFVHASDPLLRTIAHDYYLTAGVEVHLICPEQYVDDQTRVVNFTMHSISGPAALGEALRGAAVTQAQPQHGLYLVNETLRDGLLGQSAGFGPPKNVARVALDVAQIRTTFRGAMERYLYVIAHHEIGHALGIRHHGDHNMTEPIVLDAASGCIVGMVEGTVDGRPACKVAGIARRGQQNSGNALCPMKYLQWGWYEPPEQMLVYADSVEFRPNSAWSWQQPSRLPSYEGRVQRYRKDLDPPPPRGSMRLCASARGTGINALPLSQNHAGDAERTPPCSKQLRVKDMEPAGRTGG